MGRRLTCLSCGSMVRISSTSTFFVSLQGCAHFGLNETATIQAPYGNKAAQLGRNFKKKLSWTGLEPRVHRPKSMALYHRLGGCPSISRHKFCCDAQKNGSRTIFGGIRWALGAAFIFPQLSDEPCWYARFTKHGNSVTFWATYLLRQ